MLSESMGSKLNEFLKHAWLQSLFVSRVEDVQLQLHQRVAAFGKVPNAAEWSFREQVG